MRTLALLLLAGCAAALRRSGSGWDAPFATGLEDRIVSNVHGLLKE